MIALTVFFVLIAIEVTCLIIQRKQIDETRKCRSIAWLLASLLLLVALTTSLVEWSFSWIGVALVCLYETIRALLFIWRRKGGKPWSLVHAMLRVVLYIVLVLPLVVFPGAQDMDVSGGYPVATSVYTWDDVSRDETFTPEEDTRQVTVQFWYPEHAEESFPLVIFSHGAFGYRMSNYSTFVELASNGYVVCSIDHPYHAFITRQTDGKNILVDMDFLRTAMATEQGDIDGEQLYNLERGWMALRTGDMQFVLDTILEKSGELSSPEVFRHIDRDAIGVLGHSMGGATAAALGREQEEVDAVIVLDGTMMGETVAYRDGREYYIDEQYPKPILNVFNEEHGRQAATLGASYPNSFMHARSPQSYQVVVEGTGHLNFTDLPLVSPFLGKLLGTGEVDPAYAMEITNALVLNFFDRFLKNNHTVIQREQQI